MSDDVVELCGCGRPLGREDGKAPGMNEFGHLLCYRCCYNACSGNYNALRRELDDERREHQNERRARWKAERELTILLASSLQARFARLLRRAADWCDGADQHQRNA